MYQARSNPQFANRMRSMSQDRHKQENSESRRRAEENAKMIRLLSSMAPLAGAAGGAAIGGIAGSFGGPGGTAAGAMAGLGVGSALGAGAGGVGNAYADYSTEGYREEDREAQERQAQMLQLISMMR